MSLSQEKREKIISECLRFRREEEQRYDDAIGDLAMRLGISEKTVLKVWDDVI